MCQPGPQKFHKDPAALEEILNINPLTGLVLMHKVGWALGNEPADLHCHPLRRTVLIA